MQPDSILLVSSSLDDNGGVPICVGNLGAALARLGKNVSIAGQYSTAISPAIRKAATLPLVRLFPERAPWSAAGQAVAAVRLAHTVHAATANAAARGETLVVHCHGVWALGILAATRAAQAAGAFTVISPHGMLRQAAMRKSCCKKAAFFTLAVRQHLVRANAVHVTSIDEGKDLSSLLPNLKTVRAHLGILPPTALSRGQRGKVPRIAGFLGRLLPIKNLETLIYAWRALDEPNWRLRIAGPGEPAYVRYLNKLIRDCGLAERVSVEGPQPYARIGDFFADLELFIMPSISEAFSIVVGEALAAEVPVITTTATPWGGVADRGCGWVAAPTLACMTAALKDAIMRPATELAAMGRRGRNWILRDYSWDAVAESHISTLYK